MSENFIMSTGSENFIMSTGPDSNGLRMAEALGLDPKRLKRSCKLVIEADRPAVLKVEYLLTRDELRIVTEVLTADE